MHSKMCWQCWRSGSITLESIRNNAQSVDTRPKQNHTKKRETNKSSAEMSFVLTFVFISSVLIWHLFIRVVFASRMLRGRRSVDSEAVHVNKHTDNCGTSERNLRAPAKHRPPPTQLADFIVHYLKCCVWRQNKRQNTSLRQMALFSSFRFSVRRLLSNIDISNRISPNRVQFFKTRTDLIIVINV